MPPPPSAADDNRLATYLNGAAVQINTRTAQLAEAAVRGRPAWLRALGVPPEDPGRHAAWLARVTIVAAYREQHRITVDDPRHILGPYPDPDHSSYAAFCHAKRAARDARYLAESEPVSAAASEMDARSARAVSHHKEAQPVARQATDNPQALRQSRPALPDPRHAPHQQASRQDVGPRL
jgi:hypothetical protein